MPYVAKTACRACMAMCPVNVTIDDNTVVRVEGNPDAPLYGGFICPKGRGLAAGHNDPNRLTHHLKRQPDGSYRRISSEELVDDVAARLSDIIERHGPESVATHAGGGAIENNPLASMMFAFSKAIGASRMIGNASIDQPGLMMADALHGTWAGGQMRPENCEVFLIAGGNPIISKQYLQQNPGQVFKRMRRSGTKLIVIDPRRSETARKADVHLQVIPGEDPAVFAGLVHLLINRGGVNNEFVERNAMGLGKLAEAVASFTPDYVAGRAGVAAADLERAAELLISAKTGDCVSGVGTNMSTRGTLTSYLMYCLKTLRGFYPGAGEDAAHPGVLNAPRAFKAQPNGPKPAKGFGDTRVRGLEVSVAGYPISALPEEMLMPGKGQVKALFTSGNPLMNWPQTGLVKEALESLDLLVTHDVQHSPMTRIATHVVATTKQFEVPTTSQFTEAAGTAHPGYGWDEPYAYYYPALIEPPVDADLMDAWQLYYRVAQKLELPIRLVNPIDGSVADEPLDMVNEPSHDDLLEVIADRGVVSLEEVKQYPNGHLFDQARATIAEPDPDCAAFFELADDTILSELATVRAESIATRRGTNDDFPFLYISVRMQNSTGTSHRPEGVLKRPYNPLLMHPKDINRLGINEGDKVELRSRHGAVKALVQTDKYSRRGVVSLCYGFGKMPGEVTDLSKDGTNINDILSLTDDFDPVCGQPRMSAVPVNVIPISQSDSDSGE